MQEKDMRKKTKQKKTKQEKKFKAIMVRVTLEDYALLEKIAKVDRRTVTGWVRAVALDAAEAVERCL